MRYILSDNTLLSKKEEEVSLVQQLKDQTIEHLQQKNHFLLFSLSHAKDIDPQQMIFETKKEGVWSKNIVGFFGDGKEEVVLCSRFTSIEMDKTETTHDYFLQYMLQKVGHYNLIRQQTKRDRFSFGDVFIWLFPYYLNEALQKGMYKEYKTHHYNDSSVKGKLTITTHIQKNTPFIGKVAYQTREFSYDNALMQLIRHTIHFIEKRYPFILSSNEQTRKYVKQIILYTPSYSTFKKEQVIKENERKKIQHSYFEAYTRLQTLCLYILKEEKTGFGKKKRMPFGIMIDISWLFEEYLATLFTPKMIHARNKEKQEGFSLFVTTSRTRTVYPDFYNDTLILDAKYKRLEKSETGLARNDLYQMITYLHVRKVQYAGVIFPAKHHKKAYFRLVGQLDGFGGEIFKVGLWIPQHMSSYQTFIDEMNRSEQECLQALQVRLKDQDTL